ncbi:MAG: (2Fe-2S)-binding protein, partial [Pseudomonadota bacterium]
GQPGFKDEPARVSRIQPVWRGFVVSRQPLDLSRCDYWMRSRVEGGWLYEVAGKAEVNWSAALPAGEVSEVAYSSKGMRRIAVCDPRGGLEAAVFVTRAGDLPAREWVAAQLGASIRDASEVLAGRPREAAPDRGAIVCVCHDIGALEINAAISGGAGSVAAIGNACRAGTNCGSCRPELSRMLEEWDDAIKDGAIREAAE